MVNPPPKVKAPTLRKKSPISQRLGLEGVPCLAERRACDDRDGPPRAPPPGGTVQHQDHQRSDEAPGARAVQDNPCGPRQEQGGDDPQWREANGQGTGDREEDVRPRAHRGLAQPVHGHGEDAHHHRIQPIEHVAHARQSAIMVIEEGQGEQHGTTRAG